MKRFLSMVLALCLLLPVCTLAEGNSALETMLEKGAQFVEQGDFDSAAICYDIAMDLSPDDPMVLSAMASMYSSMGDYEQALAMIEEAIALAPANGALYLTKASILFLCDRLDDAASAIRYAEICDAEPDSSLCVAAAVAYARNEHYAEAVEMFDRADKNLWWNDYAELYGRSLVLAGNKDQQPGWVAFGARDEALVSAIQNHPELPLAVYQQDISNAPLFCSATTYEENIESAIETGMIGEPSADGLRVKLTNTVAEARLGEAALLAASPSGSVSLYSIDGQLFIYKDGEVTAIFPTYSRGDPNQEYASETYRRYTAFGKLFEQDSITWSPDERYFTLCFPDKALKNAQFFDLMLVDVQTGDLFVVEATPKKFSLPGAQTALCACFDQASENVYYLVYGKIDESSRCGIKKYNIASGTVELLCGTQETLIDRPGIYMDGEGRIHGVTETIKPNEHAGTILFSMDQGQWSYTVNAFANPMRIQYPVRYLYSDRSKVELALNSVSTSTYLTMNTDAVNAPADHTAIMLPVSGNQAESVAVDESLLAAIAPNPTDASASASPWMNIRSAVLSPDGYFALIMAGNGVDLGLYILDVQSLRFAKLQLPTEVQLANAMDFLSNQNLRLDWVTRDRLLIPTASGNMLFSMEIE